MPPRHSRPTLSALICLSLAAALIAVPAHAQLGALRRAAERRVEQKAEDRIQAANLIEPTFDNTTVEITAQRLDRLQAALGKLQGERASNRQRYDQMQAQYSALDDSARAAENERERTTYERARERYLECRQRTQEAADSAHQQQVQEMTARFQRNPAAAQNDPKLKAMMTMMNELVAAQQKGDAEAVQRITQRMASSMSAVIDSAGLDRAAMPKCGGWPVKPPSLVRSERLRARADSVREASAALMSAAGKVKGEDVGLTDVQASMMDERIRSWLAGMRQDAPITRAFRKEEYDLLVARRAALQRAYRGSE